MMELIKHTTEWANTDAFQGKIMVTFGIILVFSAVAILRGESALLKGTLIPIGIAVFLTLGYGGFLAFGRPMHIVKTNNSFEQYRHETIKTELKKAETDHKAYSLLLKIWPFLIAASAISVLLISNLYWKGFCVGLTGLFLSALLIDMMLHQNLEPYYNVLKELSKG